MVWTYIFRTAIKPLIKSQISIFPKSSFSRPTRSLPYYVAYRLAKSSEILSENFTQNREHERSSKYMFLGKLVIPSQMMLFMTPWRLFTRGWTRNKNFEKCLARQVKVLYYMYTATSNIHSNKHTSSEKKIIPGKINEHGLTFRRIATLNKHYELLFQ